jgi:hypothetical protein
MEKNCSVPLPINFNCWKHHAGFIIEQTDTIKSESEIEELKMRLLKIGESQMDLYYGKLSPSKISKHVIDSLKNKKLLSPEQYNTWLNNEGKGYKLLELPDKSLWTLRFSKSPDRYVHIHPGRYSPLTIRVKSTTLKTAILVFCFKQIDGVSRIDIEEVNYLRKKYLNESPLKSLSKASGLIKLIDLFRLKN